MNKLHYSATVISNLYSPPETNVLEEEINMPIDWKEEGGYNQGFWPVFVRSGLSKERSFYLMGIRPMAVFDDRLGDKKIVVQGEQAIFYQGKNQHPVLVTFGDSRNTDALAKTDSASKVVELLDNHFIGSENIEELLKTPGIAFQNHAWERTLGTFELAYQRLMESRATKASERTTSLSWEKINPEEIYTAYMNYDFEKFIDWSKKRGLDTEVVKSQFMNLPVNTEEELLKLLGMEESKINTRLSKKI